MLTMLLTAPGASSHACPQPLSVTATGAGTTCQITNGTITASGSGGTSPYSYSVNGTDFQVNGLFGGLAAGPYTVTVKDAGIVALAELAQDIRHW